MVKLPTTSQGYTHLRGMYLRADEVDKREALTAYLRYRQMMWQIASRYGQSLPAVTAAFCALSPNSDYFGNLRSLVSVLKGLQDGTPHHLITVSTYSHCKERAISYIQGTPFDTPERGLKTKSFYRNILEPDCPRSVTIDGHVVAAYIGDDSLTMSSAGIGKAQYAEISIVISALAAHEGLLPNQVQAAIWFARKRSVGIVYDPRRDLFEDKSDQWGILVPLENVKPYDLKVAA